MNILLWLLIIPVVTVFVLIFCNDRRQYRVAAAFGMGLQLIFSFYLVTRYVAERNAGNAEPMAFMYQYKWFDAFNIVMATGIDAISLSLIVLTSIVAFTGVLVSWNMEKLPKEFFISLIILATGVFGFFLTIDLFTMFLFYELAVIPMYLLIGIWGSGRKEYSAMKLTLMLMGASALLLVGVLGLYVYSSTDINLVSFNIYDIANANIPLETQKFFFPLVFIGFGVLGALFPLHTWSPDGHSSAPTAVSMLHAGVLMKMGGYGCLRVAMFLLPEAAKELAWIFIILTTISIVYGAFGAIAQKDLKYINAYSSVSHCGLVLFAMLMMNQTAMNGSVIQMISHGLMTALFFALIGMIYERTHTRDIRYMGGLMKIMPFLGVCYMIAGFASLGLPGLSGFVAEVNVFVGAFMHNDKFHRVATVIAVASIVITAVYILRVVATLLLGPLDEDHVFETGDARWYERWANIILIVSIVAIGIAPFWLSNALMRSIQPIIQKLQ
jgi:NADH-quinone oxidoreductase subunit M